MFAANAELDVRAGRAAAFGGEADQFADAFDVDADERILRVDSLVDIVLQEASGIVAADAQSGLGEIVGAEAEEGGILGDLASGKGGAGQFDHRADEVVDGDALLFEHLCRASGLNVVVAAIILWNTVYLERAVQALRDSGKDIDEKLLPHLSPLGWEHINLTGDYIWRQNKHVEQGKFRPLRLLEGAPLAMSS